MGEQRYPKYLLWGGAKNKLLSPAREGGKGIKKYQNLDKGCEDDAAAQNAGNRAGETGRRQKEIPAARNSGENLRTIIGGKK